MGKLISLSDFKAEKWPKSTINRTWVKTVLDSRKPLNDYLLSWAFFKWEVARVLGSDKLILDMTPDELQRYVRSAIMHELTKKKQINWDYYMCGEYIASLVLKVMMWEMDYSTFTQDYLTEWENNLKNFKWAGDINLAKFIFWLWKRIKEINTQKDYIDRATWMYYHAYAVGQLDLGYQLAYNLHEIDAAVNLQAIPTKIFKREPIEIRR